MTSPYLEHPLRPLNVALPRLLESIEAQLINERLEAAEEVRLRWRAGLIHRLLAPRLVT
jgi:hypothetical protein